MAEKVKAVFLDKDGTLIPDIPYNVNPDLIELNAGVAEGLQLLKKLDYVFVVISNQAGVARGYFKYSELEKVSGKLDALLQPKDIQINAYYFCPHHPDGKVPEYTQKCNCRKPHPGMILQAVKDLDIDITSSWMVGDILNDVEAGNRAGCKTVIIRNGNETEWLEGQFRTPDYIADNFLAAAKFISNFPYEISKQNDKKLAAL